MHQSCEVRTHWPSLWERLQETMLGAREPQMLPPQIPEVPPGLHSALESSTMNLWPPESRLGCGWDCAYAQCSSDSSWVAWGRFRDMGTLCQEQLVTYQAKKKPLSSIHGYELTLLSAPPLPAPSLSFIDSLKSGAGTAESTPVASSLTL